MFDIKIFDGMTVESKLDTMLSMLEGLIRDEEDDLTNICNAAALINALIGRINWCGFYLMKNDQLVLGPFQGMPACTRIEMGKGVCGEAASKRKTMLVEYVHKFPGHIACDAASNSEIVIPIVKDGELYGVLDLDSAEFNRFTNVEQEYLEKAVEILNKYIFWENVIN